MDFLFLKQLVLNCAKLILSMKISSKQKPYFVTFSKVLNIMDRQSAYTYIILYNGKINVTGVIDIFEKYIKPTIGLLFSIISDQDVLFMLTEWHN